MFRHYFEQYPGYYVLFLGVVVVCVVAIWLVVRNAKKP